MIWRIVEADNNCLFNSISLLVEGKKNPKVLREYIVKWINADETYNEAILGMSKKDYSKWILNPEKWGGEIEIVILSDYFEVQICVIYIEALTYKVYGESYAKRIYLLYDGLHYDPITRNYMEEAD